MELDFKNVAFLLVCCVVYANCLDVDKERIVSIIQNELAKELREIKLQSTEQNRRICEIEETIKHLTENCESVKEFYPDKSTTKDDKRQNKDVLNRVPYSASNITADVQSNAVPTKRNDVSRIQKGSTEVNPKKWLLSNSKTK